MGKYSIQCYVRISPIKYLGTLYGTSHSHRSLATGDPQVNFGSIPELMAIQNKWQLWRINWNSRNILWQRDPLHRPSLTLLLAHLYWIYSIHQVGLRQYESSFPFEAPVWEEQIIVLPTTSLVVHTPLWLIPLGMTGFLLARHMHKGFLRWASDATGADLILRRVTHPQSQGQQWNKSLYGHDVIPRNPILELRPLGL